MTVFNKSSTVKYVYYDPDSGFIHAISSNKQEDIQFPFIEVLKEDVRPIQLGTVCIKNVRVKYNIDEKKFKLEQQKENLELFDVSDEICEFENDLDNADIIVVQDIKNTCWKILIDKTVRSVLLANMIEKKVFLTFSVTEKDNPNILFKILRVPMLDLLQQGYIILPYTENFEKENVNLSLYTSKKFASYSYKVSK